MSDPTPGGEGAAPTDDDDGAGRDTGSVTAVIDAHYDPDRSYRCETAGSDADAEFERRLTELVTWGLDHDVAFDRAWTIRPDRAGHDVMAELVYLDDGSRTDERTDF